MTSTSSPGWNWAKTHQFRASQLHRPSSIDELGAVIEQAAVAGTALRCVGARHSFTGIADADGLLDLSALPERCEPNGDKTTVTINAAMTYARLAELLAPLDLAVANTASLPHLTVAGAITTATHGSGDDNGNLATAVRSLDVATSAGMTRSTQASDSDFAAAPVALGALGAIVGIELAVEPAFEIEQAVHNDLGWHTLTATFDDIFGSAYSVSVFTDWCDHVQLWTKRRRDQPAIDHAQLHDGVRATVPQHPVPGADASGCTDQVSVGLWSDRLPHFRADAIPSVGAEVQSEFFVERRFALEAIERMRSIGPDLKAAMMVSEIRTVRRDDLWLSPQYERDCMAMHFTWHHDLPTARRAAQAVASVLAPLSPLPHWGKVFDPGQFDFADLYPRLADAQHAFASWDPAGVFTNRWLLETL